MTNKSGQDIAIIGMSGRFPGATSIAAFWENLENGIESIARLSDEDLAAAHVDPATSGRPDYVKAAPTLTEIEAFDASLFGLSPREAEVTDPQHRIFLECAWEALEDAGYDSESYAGLIGVYAGACANSYLVHNLLPHRGGDQAVGGLETLIGNDKDYLTTRVSYRLNLRGPSVGIQTACSTSLVAVHMACESLLSAQCDMALAGGVTVRVPHRAGYVYEEGALSSPDGHCRAFDAGARGTVAGSGCGIVVLKRLRHALTDGDTVRAVIKGSAINNDGAAKVGYTAPGLQGQADVIAAALAVANVRPEQVSYVEAHGTGTPLGDPVEIAALAQVFGPARAGKPWCAVGSVKTNIGHLDTAAGVAGLIKTVLAMQHRRLPPSLNFERPNPRIRFEETPFRINAALTPWKTRPGVRRRAGVSSFGIGGTNAHVVLEEAPKRTVSKRSSAGEVLLVLSARSLSALDRATARLAAHLRAHPEQPLADVAHTLQVGRRAFSHRRVALCRDRDEAIRSLETLDPTAVSTGFREHGGRSVIFALPSLGTQRPNLGRELYDREATFKADVDRCLERLAGQVGLDLREAAYPSDERLEWSTRQLQHPAAAEAALFAVQYATARLFGRWGIRPHAMVAEGIGEYVAACLAGVFSLEDALDLLATRGDIASRSPGGRPDDRQDAFDTLLRRAGKLSLRPPEVPYISSMTGSWVTDRDATDPGYWARPLTENPPRSEALSELLKECDPVPLEIGPGGAAGTLLGGLPDLARRSLPSLGCGNGGDPIPAIRSLGRLWLEGVPVEWTGLASGARRRRVPLPTYPFERDRYWINPPAVGKSPAASRPNLTRRNPDVASWFSIPVWKQSIPPPDAEVARAEWIVFIDECGLGAGIAERLRKAHGVTTVRAGTRFQRLGADAYSIAPRVRGDYDALLADLRGRGRAPSRVAHLWTVTPAGSNGHEPEMLSEAQDRGFSSLILLAQAVGARSDIGPLEITVVSNGLQDVESGDVTHAAKAMLLGPCKVIPQEYLGTTCRSVDIRLDAAPTSAAGLVEQLVRELTSTTPDASVAYRGSRRWVLDVGSARLDPVGSGQRRLRTHGVYLVTGGLGGIGLTLAEHLARLVQARLVLVGRSAFPRREEWDTWVAAHGEQDGVARTIRALERIEGLAAEVMTATADVTDEPQMRAVVAQARERFGALHGVIHAAGIPGGGVIQRKTLDAAAAVLAPKVRGTLVLEAVLADAPLDFLFLCSSTIARTGAVGQADYCAANAFLDAFARQHSDRPGRLVVSVGWDAWEQVGMAARAREVRGISPVAESPDRHSYSMRLSVANHWILAEHRILGRAVLPGTAYIEMIRAALQSSAGERAIDIRDLTFSAPLIVEEDQVIELRAIAQRSGDGFDVRIVSRTDRDSDERWREQARATVAFVVVPPPRHHDVANLMRSGRMTQVAISHEGPARQTALVFGPRWDTVREAYAGDEEAVAVLELPDAFAADLEQYALHPSLLDTASSFAVHPRDGEHHVPVVYGRIRIMGALPRRVVSHVRGIRPAPDRATLTFDVLILNEHGAELVAIDGLVLRRVADLAAAFRSQSGESPRHAHRSADSVQGILPHEGAEAFDRILARHQLPEIIVSTREFREVMAAAHAYAVADGAPQNDAEMAPTFHPRPGLDEEYVAPNTGIEHRLAGIWRDVLRVEPIGVHDDFFALGGDSVMALQIVSRARESGLVLTAAALFEHSTIAGLAATLASVTVTEEAAHETAAAARVEECSTPEDFPEARVSRRDLDKVLQRTDPARASDP